jgi:hypothetical protein
MIALNRICTSVGAGEIVWYDADGAETGRRTQKAHAPKAGSTRVPQTIVPLRLEPRIREMAEI